MLRRSKSSFNGALSNLNDTLRGLESPQVNHTHVSMRVSTNTEYEKRIKLLENEVQTCVAIDQAHKI